MFGGAYSRKYRDLEAEKLAVGRNNVSQGHLLVRKLSMETNKRRRAMEERRKAREEAENRRREEILAERKKKQREASSLIRIQKIQYSKREKKEKEKDRSSLSTRSSSPKVNFSPHIKRHFYPVASFERPLNGYRVVEGYKVEIGHNQTSARPTGLDEALRTIRGDSSSRSSSNSLENRDSLEDSEEKRWIERVDLRNQDGQEKDQTDLSLEDVSSPELEEDEEVEKRINYDEVDQVNLSADSIENLNPPPPRKNDVLPSSNYTGEDNSISNKNDKEEEKFEPLPSKNVAWTVPLSPSLTDFHSSDSKLSDLRKASSDTCVDTSKRFSTEKRSFNRSVVMDADATVAVHAALSEYLAAKTLSKTNRSEQQDPGQFTSYVQVSASPPQSVGSCLSVYEETPLKGILKPSSAGSTGLSRTGSKKTVRFANADQVQSIQGKTTAKLNRKKGSAVLFFGKKTRALSDSTDQRRETISVANIARKAQSAKGANRDGSPSVAGTGNRRYFDESSIEGAVNGLEKTPTDEEIDELWGKVRLCLRVEDGKSPYRNGDSMAFRRSMLTQRPTMSPPVIRDASTTEGTARHSQNSPEVKHNIRQKSDKPKTALSLEEQQVLKSLERLNTKLNERQVALHRATVSITTIRPQFSQSSLTVQQKKRASGALPKTRIRRNPQALAAEQSRTQPYIPAYRQPSYTT